MDCVTYLILIILIFASYTYWRFKDLPPGPYGLPLLGYALFFGNTVKERQETFTKLTTKYGKIYSINLANNPVVVLNDWETINEVLVKQGNTFSGRPHNFTLDFLFERKELVSGDGPIWKEQKRISSKILQQLGMGKSSIENIIMEEVEKITIDLERHNGKSLEMSKKFFFPILNVIWGLSAGKHLDADKSTSISFRTAIEDIARLNAQAGLLNLLPALRYIAPDLIGFTDLFKAKQTIYNYIKQEVDNHIENFQENSLKDFIDYYLAEMKNRKEEMAPYDKEHLIFTIYVLFAAGAETISSTLSWAILYMALYPDIQQKVQQEMKTVIGENNYLSTVSKSLVPYTNATLLEIQRITSITPLSVPHCPIKDTMLEGFKIPKGTTILTNLFDLHNDEEYWGDPYTFRPERFIDEAGQLKKDNHLLPFSAGPRVCVGENLAKTEIFLFFTCLMHRFSFQLIAGQPKPSLEPMGGIALYPKPYSVMIHRRK